MAEQNIQTQEHGIGERDNPNTKATHREASNGASQPDDQNQQDQQEQRSGSQPGNGADVTDQTNREAGNGSEEETEINQAQSQHGPGSNQFGSGINTSYLQGETNMNNDGDTLPDDETVGGWLRANTQQQTH